jgi:Domain of unknown function (DUF4389)
MDEQLKSNLLSSTHWLRLIFMLLFAGLLQLAVLVMWFVVTLQFVFSLITGKDNSKLRELGYGLSTFIYQCLQFLSYNSDEKPFPFSDWPEQTAPADYTES